ncbi:biotin transporter BioY [Actibacterium ureilyticum]|uniref:biotin transporter BioY n=1 Tax=Actibacterium ureilyticum TaxID=1590614 RepID=UPI000BAB0BC4|nr:biotin transporter BioY [Actibacterium ureilyticum]
MQNATTRSLPVAGGQILKLSLAVCLLTLSAKTTVPFFPVPMTMHVMATLLLAGLGGLRFGALSLLSYLAVGAAGMPVFTGTPEKGIGLAYMVGPTGGYLAGFLVAAVLVGWAVDRFGRRAVWWAMPVALGLVYALGLAWLSRFVPSDKLLALGLMPFVLGDLLKVAMAALLTTLAPARLTRWIRG